MASSIHRAVAVILLALSSSVAALYINGSVIAPCDSPIYCYGELLKQVELARPFVDSKTFVDMPAIKSLDEIQAAFEALPKPLSNNSDLQSFLSENFAAAGSELSEVSRDELDIDPQFLERVNDTVIREFVAKVIDIWPDLTREYTGDDCEECPDSYIPINRTFVIAGGRFREPYYWDSYWILEGLLRTGGSFVEISRNQIENFLDFVESFGFVPNGARIYFLNRSQPPLLSQMVKLYVNYTNDTSILDRAVPLLIKEHEFWTVNRTIDVVQNGTTYSLNRYAVLNTQPRPESYREDYITAENSSYYAPSGIIYPETERLNQSTKAELYANLATGAESGWDYTSRWLSRPQDVIREVYFPLRSLNTKNIIPVELNSILYGNEIAISEFLRQTGNESGADAWASLAASRSEAMYQVMWNETLYRYFDYNITRGGQDIYVPLNEEEEDTSDEDETQAESTPELILDQDYTEPVAPAGQQVFFSVSQFFPFWTGAAPDFIKNNPLAVKNAFAPVAHQLATNAGGIAATNLETSEQWDKPNVWPPLMHILIDGLLKTPATFGDEDPAYEWTQELALRLAQRYLDSTFCTWYATGGSTSETPTLEGLEERDGVGIMFEKYTSEATNVAGGGGEYEVVEGFGWSNGVLIYIADMFAERGLARPQCGDIEAADVEGDGAAALRRLRRRRERRAVELDPSDARWVKRFGKRASK